MKSHLSCLELAWPNRLAKNSLNYILVIFQLILVVWLYLNDIIEDKVVIVSRWPYSIKLDLVAVLSVLSNANLRSGVSSCWVLISFWLITCVEVGESRSWASLEKLNFVFIWLSQLLFQTVRTVNGLKIIIYLWLLLGWLPRVRVCMFLYTQGLWQYLILLNYWSIMFSLSKKVILCLNRVDMNKVLGALSNDIFNTLFVHHFILRLNLRSTNFSLSLKLRNIKK